MLNVRIKINCENDAFADNCEGEVARLLREVAKKISNGELDRLGYLPIMDANGNKVGEVNTQQE